MRPRALAVLAALLALLVAGCGGSDGGKRPEALGGGSNAAEAPPVQTTTTKVEVISSLGDGEFNPQAIYKKEAPGVVTVISQFGEGGLEALLGGDGGGAAGLGSGFVLNGNGEIATNAHVVTKGEGKEVERAKRVYVEFADDNQVEAKILGFDPNADIALLKIDPKGLDLHPLPLAAGDEIAVGSPVAALGSPYGERQSLSVGVVSATDRTIDSLTSFRISGAVQTDAAINPGNSGGPLLNARGEVIGVNQQIKTNSGGGEGVGFAVPVAMVRRSLQQLREKGKAEYAYLGVASKALYPQLVERFGLPTRKGAWIQEVTAGGPAARAGLKGGTEKKLFQVGTFSVGGDIVTRIGNRPVDDPDDLSAAIAHFEPGEKVKLRVFRGDDEREIEVTLGERPLDPPSGG